MSKLFLILHTCAILMYCASWINANNNWLLTINKAHEGPITRYIYSLYFTGITMFTVGYGDILPQN